MFGFRGRAGPAEFGGSDQPYAAKEALNFRTIEAIAHDAEAFHHVDIDPADRVGGDGQRLRDAIEGRQIQMRMTGDAGLPARGMRVVFERRFKLFHRHDFRIRSMGRGL